MKNEPHLNQQHDNSTDKNIDRDIRIKATIATVITVKLVFFLSLEMSIC